MGTAASVAAAGTITGFPNIVQAADPIRTIGLGVSIINEIQSKAAKDVGFKIRGQAIDYGALFAKSLQQNDQFEVSECYFDMFDFMIPSKVFQPIDTKRIKDWDKVSNLSKTGKLPPGSQVGHLSIRLIPSATTRIIRAVPSIVGPSCSAPISRARWRSSTSPRSVPWMRLWA